jgi:hypothetical protein
VISTLHNRGVKNTVMPHELLSPPWGRRVEEERGAGPTGSRPFPFPAHQTGRALFEHPAFRQTSPSVHGRLRQRHETKHAQFSEHNVIRISGSTQRGHSSVITPKPARHDHFKTGQPTGSGQLVCSAVWSSRASILRRFPFILTSPGRRVRQRRDATGAPT